MKFNWVKAKEVVDASPLKRAHIAAECGIEHDTLTSYLNGRSYPSRAVMKLLSRVLNVTESQITEPDDDEGPTAA